MPGARATVGQTRWPTGPRYGPILLPGVKNLSTSISRPNTFASCLILLYELGVTSARRRYSGQATLSNEDHSYLNG